MKLSAMCRFMSRDVVRVATWKSRVLIFLIGNRVRYCLRCEQYPRGLVLSRHFLDFEEIISPQDSAAAAGNAIKARVVPSFTEITHRARYTYDRLPRRR